MTLGKDWSFFAHKVDGWLASEKLDGCRAYWHGGALWTRSGARIAAPAWFTAGLPNYDLDGEVFAGRGRFVAARNAVNHGAFDETIRFVIFDCPTQRGTWAQRMAYAPTTNLAQPVEFHPVQNRAALVKEFHAMKRAGGEGLMLRNPATVGYVKGRTETLLKVK